MPHILLIDDDEQLNRMMALTFSRNGYKVTCANNGTQGITCLNNDTYDVVVTDIVMPGQDGIEVITYLNERKARPVLIAISGGSQRLHANFLLTMAKTLKVDAVLPKPFTPSMLLEAVETQLVARTAPEPILRSNQHCS